MFSCVESCELHEPLVGNKMGFFSLYSIFISHGVFYYGVVTLCS